MTTVQNGGQAIGTASNPAHYERHAATLVDQYESLSFEHVHANLLEFLPSQGATILDVGAGSGRDAAWFASRGYDVVAVEPSDEMRKRARQLHRSERIHWLSDSLPDLKEVRRLGLSFDLILLSAVWMHVPPGERDRALRKLATMLAPNGRIAISLRIAAPDQERGMFEVSLSELTMLSQKFGLRLIHSADSVDKLGRKDVAWTTTVLGLPDDGVGALPLLRHLILVDEKSSTYKIALLRIIARIADTAAGIARHESESIVLPMGLVALFWLRMYKPLLENGLPQMPVSRAGTRPGFATDSFHALRLIHPVELRVGAIVHGDPARHLHRSLSEITQLIRTMPAKYLRWPASDRPIFEIRPLRRSTTPQRLVIDDAFLWSFGEFHVPLPIWHSFSHHNVWVEPALVAEWVRLIEGYVGTRMPNVRALANDLLAWADPERDTRLARDAVARIREKGRPVYCVWSGARLRDEYDVDHCFPFSAWPCGDAWNLMPASKRINIEKSNRLVTQSTLERASDHIMNWWSDAFVGESEVSKNQFFAEATQTLPIFAPSPDLHDVIDAMKIHRVRLSKDQGLRPWEPRGTPISAASLPATLVTP